MAFVNDLLLALQLPPFLKLIPATWVNSHQTLKSHVDKSVKVYGKYQTYNHVNKFAFLTAQGYMYILKFPKCHKCFTHPTWLTTAERSCSCRPSNVTVKLIMLTLLYTAGK